MTQQNKTRYNYAGNGRNGSNNKGKTYINYTITPDVTPDITERLNTFNKWFTENYNNIISNLKNKNNYNEEVLNNTYLKVYKYIEYGGIINNYQYYWNTAYFTNEFNYTCTTTKYNNKFETTTTDNFEIIDDEADEQYLKKDALIEEIADWLNNNVNNLIHRELFIIYINTKYDGKYKMTYKKLSEITGVPLSEIIKVIPLIKKELQEELKIKRLQTL